MAVVCSQRHGLDQSLNVGQIQLFLFMKQSFAKVFYRVKLSRPMLQTSCQLCQGVLYTVQVRKQSWPLHICDTRLHKVVTCVLRRMSKRIILLEHTLTGWFVSINSSRSSSRILTYASWSIFHSLTTNSVFPRQIMAPKPLSYPHPCLHEKIQAGRRRSPQKLACPSGSLKENRFSSENFTFFHWRAVTNEYSAAHNFRFYVRWVESWEHLQVTANYVVAFL